MPGVHHIPRARARTRLLGSVPATAHRAEFPGATAAAEEAVLAVGFETRHRDTRRQFQGFDDLAVVRIDMAQFARVVFPGGMPHLAIHPAHAGDEAVRLDGTQDLPGLRIDLVDLALAIHADPQRTFRPGHAGITAAAGRRDRG